MPQFELRKAADGKTWHLDGYASRTSVGYNVADARGRYIETINQGAFRSTLSRGADVVLCIEHAPPFIARTPATLTLEEDANGLRVDASLDAADPDVQATVSKVKRGILPEMSFSFRVPVGGDTWSEDGTQRSITTLDMDGGDVSIVRRGSNRATEVSVRGSATGRFEVRSSGLVAVRQEPCTNDGSWKRSRTPSIADLELRAAWCKSAAAEERFEMAHGDQQGRIDTRNLRHCGHLADEALRRGDTRSAAMWMRQEALELEALALL